MIKHTLRGLPRIAGVALGALAAASLLMACDLNAPPPAGPIADTFSRTVSSGWGSAEGGDAWSTSPSGLWSVTGTAGSVAVAAGSEASATVATAARDSNASVVLAADQAPTGSDLLTEVSARRQATGEEYRARLRSSVDGVFHLALVRRSSGVDLLIGQEQTVTGVSASAGQRVALRFSVSGALPTTLRAKAWTAGATEPSAWLVQGSDGSATLQRSGTTGLGFAVPASATSAPVTWTADDLIVTDAAAPVRSFGAPALGSTAYPVPSGALYVAISGDDGNPGTVGAPLRNLATAASRAPDGTTIVVRGGTYHESVTWYQKRLTIQPAAGEQVWLTGADQVGGWVADGSTWRRDNWSPDLLRTAHPEAIDPAYPMATAPDMTFIDDVALRQVSARNQVGPGTFFVDLASRALFIGDDPSGRDVEASTRWYGVWVNHGYGSVIRGIGIERYATHVDQNGALRALADAVTVQDSVFRQNATAGISVMGTGSVVRNNTMTDNGQAGLIINASDSVLVDGNEMTGNNRERFAYTYAEGGAKLTTATNVTISNNLSAGNFGRGFWVDIDSSNVRIVRNVIRDNIGRGVEYEISGTGIIASNVIARNHDYSIYVLESSNVKVFNNTLYQNQELKVGEGGRPENVAAVSIANNLSLGPDPVTSSMFTVDDYTRQRSAEQLGVTADYDHYRRLAATTPTYITVWASYPNMIRVFKTISAFSAATGQETHGTGTDGPTDPWFVDHDADDLRLRINAPVLGRATPLPSDVAAVLGLPAGQAVDPGAL